MTNDALKKITCRTIGCRLNQYETEKMAASLYPYGFRRALPGETADLCLINTCTVTHRADQSSRQVISRTVRDNPGAKIVVIGCYVDAAPEQMTSLYGVTLALGNRYKDNLAEILALRFPDLFENELANVIAPPPITDFSGHNRAWIKISDGCDHRCAYCILPLVRGPLKNRPARDIIKEINSLIAAEFDEIVITGLNMGMYHDRQAEPKIENLAALCRWLLRQTDFKRLRLSSVEPQTIDHDLIEVFAEAGERLCRHWHLSLQSGSPRILKLMRRPYTREDFIECVVALKKAQPNTIVGADIIVGFPGETDEDFNASKNLAESGLLDYLHVFSYSDRPGTEAEKMPDKINPKIIKKRNNLLVAVSRQVRKAAYLRQVGQTLGVIAENKKRDGNFFYAMADNFMRVKMPAHFKGGKKIARVKITRAFDDYLEGELLD